MAERRGTMAEFIVREVREGDKSQIQLVIHGDEVMAESAWLPVGLYGHPLYLELYQHTLREIDKAKS